MTTQQQTPTPVTAPAYRPPLPSEVAARARQIAADYTTKSHDIMDGDGRYGGLLVEELIAALAGIADDLDRHQAVAAPTAGAPACDVARTAARSAVDYVEYEGWFPVDGRTPVPDACADAALAALTAAGMITEPSQAIPDGWTVPDRSDDGLADEGPGCPVCGAPTNGVPCPNRPAGSPPGTPSCADLAAPSPLDELAAALNLDEHRADDDPERWTTAGQPHPVAAARAQAAAERLPTVGRWHDGPTTTKEQN